MADIQMSEEQIQQVADAQARFTELKSPGPQLDQPGLDLLFNEGRSQNGWQDKPVGEDILRELYKLMRMGATSMNCCPARFVFVHSAEGKEKIKPALLPNNVDKVMSAPVVAVIGYDPQFYSKMGQLFPHMDVAPMFAGNDALAEITAFRNGTLQGAYLMLAARALGLDCGPMSGFDNGGIDEAFFAGTAIKSNFLCCLGYGNPQKIFQRLPRLSFEEACELV
jgi:3-hydroxypropanoate dehydrogenase